MTTLAPPALTQRRTPRRFALQLLVAMLAVITLAACGPAAADSADSPGDAVNLATTATDSPSATATDSATPSATATATPTADAGASVTPSPSSTAKPRPAPIPRAVTVAAATPMHSEETLTWDGKKRSAATWRPGLQKAPMPLLIELAGRGSSPLGEQMRTHLNLLADQGKAVVVFPRQMGRSWNAGRCCDDAKSDDSGYIAALVQQLVVEGIADPHRVYVSGFSVGGMMAYRLACDHPTMFAGVASVGGVSVSSCPAHFQVPLLEIHSRLDTEVPLGGSRTSALTGAGAKGLPGVGATVQNWRIRNGCTSNLYVGHATHIGPLEIRTVPGCPKDATVKLVQTLIPGHNWGGPTVDTSAMVWSFLSAQAR